MTESPAPTFADLDAVASGFLSITPAKRMDRVKNALHILLQGYTAGEIYNAEFKDLKMVVDRAFEDSYNERVRVSYWIGDAHDVRNPDYAVYDALGYANGVRNAIAMSKKLAKMKPAERATCQKQWDIAKDFIDATLPLAQVLEILKTKTVSGRKPLSPEKAAVKAAQLAAKDLKTCACCFREIARYPNGLIADHGYTLPPSWGKTASCPGRKFRPLEVSDDGLKYMVDLLTGRCAEIEKAIAALPNRTTLLVQSYGKKHEAIGPDDPRWKKTYDATLSEFQDDLKYTTKSLKQFEQRLASWKPAENMPESISSLTTKLRALVD